METIKIMPVRRKQEYIEAIQYDGTNHDSITKWSYGTIKLVDSCLFGYKHPCMESILFKSNSNTLHHILQVDDWVVKDNEHFVIMSYKDFYSTYENIHNSILPKTPMRLLKNILQGRKATYVEDKDTVELEHNRYYKQGFVKCLEKSIEHIETFGEEDEKKQMVDFALKTYKHISRLKKVPENLISENKYLFEEFYDKTFNTPK